MTPKLGGPGWLLAPPFHGWGGWVGGFPVRRDFPRFLEGVHFPCLVWDTAMLLAITRCYERGTSSSTDIGMAM